MCAYEQLFLSSYKRFNYVKQVGAQEVLRRNADLKVGVLLYAVEAETFMRDTDRQCQSYQGWVIDSSKYTRVSTEQSYICSLVLNKLCI